MAADRRRLLPGAVFQRVADAPPSLSARRALASLSHICVALLSRPVTTNKPEPLKTNTK